MKKVSEKNLGISTILSFALIPLSAFATDIYIPSLPAMVTNFHVNNAGVQLTIALFMVSMGIGQLFVGSLLDSFGRYHLALAAILIFSLSSFAIGFTAQIEIVYALRVIQGIATSIIVVAKRAFFVDVYSGEKLKNYISLFSIIWAAAPILAPFIGGYLQIWFGWQSNFYFLGIVTAIIFILEIVFNGESLNEFKPFKLKSILQVYSSTLRTLDYTLGLFLITLNYALVVVFGLVSPFVIEHVYHRTAVLTGYSSLLSGAALMTGGIISKSMIDKPLPRKVTIGIILQALLAIIMTVSASIVDSVYTFIGFTLCIHILAGFVFNNCFAYCLGRFTTNAGIVSGITGGSLFALASMFSYGVVNTLEIKNQQQMGIVFLTIIILFSIVFAFFVREFSKVTVR